MKTLLLLLTLGMTQIVSAQSFVVTDSVPLTVSDKARKDLAEAWQKFVGSQRNTISYTDTLGCLYGKVTSTTVHVDSVVVTLPCVNSPDWVGFVGFIDASKEDSIAVTFSMNEVLRHYKKLWVIGEVPYAKLPDELWIWGAMKYPAEQVDSLKRT